MDEIKISGMALATTVIGSDPVAGVNEAATKGLTAEKILMVQSLTAVRWGDNRLSPTASRAGGSKDPDFAKYKDNGSGSQGVFLWHFDDTIEEELYFDVAAKPNYKEGTTSYAQVCWIPKINGSAGEKVSWGIELTVANLGEIFGNTELLYADTSIPDETLIADKLYCTEFAVAMPTLLMGATAAARLFRDATGVGGTDTYTGDAILISISIKYEIDALGASTRSMK